MKKHRATPASSPRRRARSSAVVEGGSARRYIESSALVAALIEGDAAARASMRARGQRVMSALTVAEANRAMLRARLSGRITAQQQRLIFLTLQRFVRRCYIVSISD